MINDHASLPFEHSRTYCFKFDWRHMNPLAGPDPRAHASRRHHAGAALQPARKGNLANNPVLLLQGCRNAESREVTKRRGFEPNTSLCVFHNWGPCITMIEKSPCAYHRRRRESAGAGRAAPPCDHSPRGRHMRAATPLHSVHCRAIGAV